MLRTLGYPDDYARLPLRRLLAHVLRSDRQRLWSELRHCLSQSCQGCRLDVRLLCGEEQPRWFELVAEVGFDEAGQASIASGLVIDISRRKQGEQRAMVAAEYDELTGVMNRRGLTRRLRAILDSTPTLYCHLLLIDIDHFKQINDRYGHPAGDALLKLLATRLGNELRGRDVLARMGGEEFAVFVSELDDGQVMQLGERLRACIADTPFPLSSLATNAMQRQVDITISIGIAGLTPGQAQQEAQDLAIARADQALYAAKHAGRNRVLLFGQHEPSPEPQGRPGNDHSLNGRESD
ncbi:GGDEF domain-containing protein [Billgrantia kenyensis]|uniref:GGDEF domain-containing protein n=1 Tax=Billgrantia kenyensis TaxID=321266 RepID=UPI001EF04C85|nr:GGDEF domain-containing protein [Halomonas kenyensis]